MSYGPGPGEWQAHAAGQQPGDGAQPAYPGQAWPAGPYGGQQGQQVPPGYGQPGYGAAGYGMPGYGAGPYGQPPPTHLVWARIAAAAGVLCSVILGLPSGLIAMRYARKVGPLWDSGQQQAAVSASRRARAWAIVSTVLDALGVILLVLILVTGAARSTSDFSNPAVVAASIKAQLQKRVSDPSSPFYQAGLSVTSVVCTPAGTRTDRCVDHFSDGQTESEIAVISANGDSYRTH